MYNSSNISNKLLTILLTILLLLNSTLTIYAQEEDEQVVEDTNTQEILQEEDIQKLPEVIEEDIQQEVNEDVIDENNNTPEIIEDIQTLEEDDIQDNLIQSSPNATVIDSGKCGINVNYVLYSDGSLVISGTGDMTSHPWDNTKIKSVDIQYGVTSIAYEGFGNCRSLISVTIPNSVTTIDEAAFSWCTSLISVTIPNSVTTIARQAFYECRSLVSATISNSVTTLGYQIFSECISLPSVTIPNSVKTIDEQAFEGCSSLTTITIPNSVTSIGKQSFYLCSLSSVTIPNSVKTIGESAFGLSDSLTSITIPSSVTSIGNYAFSNCPSLESITVDPNNPNYDSRNNCNAIIETSTNTLITGCKNTVIPNTIKSIGERAFEYYRSLTTITIPNSVTSIGNYAFYGCSSLASITIPNSVITIGNRAFGNCSSLASITIPKSVKTIDSRAFDSCFSLTSIYIPSAVVSIITSNGYPFGGCNTLTIYTDVASSSKVPSGWGKGWNNSDGNTTIPVKYGYSYEDYLKEVFNIIDSGSCGPNVNYVLYDDGLLEISGTGEITSCPWEKSKIKTVDIQYGVTTMCASIFRNCSSLTSINIPNSVTSISDFAFCDCSLLTSVTIGNSVTTIGDHAFSWCSSLTSITIPNSVTAILRYAFDNCTSLASVAIPNSVKTISEDAFVNCSSLITITIPNSVTAIGDQVFSNCSSLITITIPNSVTSIGNEAFYCCSSLTSIVIPDSVQSIGYGLFSSCSSLESITVEPNNPKYDSRNNCNAIIETSTNTLITGCKNTIIPNTVSSIGSHAFDCSSSLISITIPNSVTAIGDYAFWCCSSLTSIYIPNTTITINGHPFGYCNDLTIYTNVVSPSKIPSGWEEGWNYCDNDNLVPVKYGYSLHDYYEEVFGAIDMGICGPNATYTVYKDYSMVIDGTGAINDYDYDEHITNYYQDVKSIVINDGITSIGERSLNDYSSLTSITIPKTVTEINVIAVRRCDLLTKIIVDTNNPKYDSRDNCNAIIEKDTNKLILGCNNSTIPSSVVTIGLGAFDFCRKLKSIAIPNSVKTIESDAFDSCESLTSINIPSSVTRIDNNVFAFCPSLTSISVNSSNKSYDSRNNCNAIIETSTNKLIQGCVNTTIPNDVTSIGTYAFSSSKLTSIKIPDSVKTIEGWAFTDSHLLESVVLPDSITIINSGTFNECEKLKKINMPNSVTSIGSYAFCRCESLESLTIPNSVKNIEERAFSSCVSLKTVYLPKTVINMPGNSEYQYGDRWAFVGCHDLVVYTDVTNSTSIPSGWKKDWNYCDFNTPLTVKYGYSYEDYLKEVFNIIDSGKCGDNVNYVLYNDGSLVISGTGEMTSHPWDKDKVKSVDIQYGVTSICDEAFRNCASLTLVTISNSVTTIGNHGFDCCTSLATITIPDSVKTIGNYAFNGCSSLISIIIPDSVTTIGDGVFSECFSLTSVDIGNSVTSIGISAFYYCSSLTSITIPKSVTSLGNNISIFECCSSLESITVEPNNPKYDSRNNCNAIIETSTNTLITGCKNTIIPNTVKTIGSNSFHGCKSFASFEIPDSITSINQQAFYGCSSLKSISIPDSVTSIGEWVFGDCPSLTSVYIPKTVTTIIAEHGYTFMFCENLTIYTNVDSSSKVPSGWGPNWNYYSFEEEIPVVYNTSREEYEAMNNTYTIHFDSNGATSGSMSDMTNLSYLGSYTLSENKFVKTGYTFDSWNTKKDGTGTKYLDKATITELSAIDKDTVTLYAKWTPITYTISYNLDGGTTSKDNPTSYTIESNDITLINPTKKGYTFKGWSGTGLTGDDNKIVTISKGSTGNREYKANYTANTGTKYTVKHYIQKLDGTYELKDSEELSGTTGTSVTPNTKTYDGFTAPNKQTITIKADGTSLVEYNYSRNSYTVTVTAGKGISSTTGSGTYKYEQSVTIGAQLATGYKDITYTGDKTVTTFTMPSKNVNITASATPITYSISYNLDGGTTSKDNPTSYTIESNDITLINPTKKGYTFKGWSGTGLTGDENKTVTISKGSTGDKTFTANWIPNTYTINFNPLGGTVNPTSIVVTYDSKYGTLPIPSKEESIFDGWYLNYEAGVYFDLITEDSIVLIENNSTLYAKWIDFEQVSSVISNIPTDSRIDNNSKIILSTNTSNATIYYTLDGTNPTTSSNKYDDSEYLSLSTSEIEETITVKAFATANNMKDSDISTFTYTVVNNTAEDIENIIDRQYYLDHEDDCQNIWTSSLEDETYTSKAITPQIRVYDNTKLLTKDVDYTIKYSNNTKVGEATITITGKGNYSSSFTRPFHIIQKKVVLNELADVYLTYNTKGVSISTPKVSFDNTTLKNNTDYTYTVKDDKGNTITTTKLYDVGTYTVSINSTDKSNYTFDTISYNIYVQNVATYKISTPKLTGFKSSLPYDSGEEVRQDDIVLTHKIDKNTTKVLNGILASEYKASDHTQDYDYTYTYLNNTKVGTATILIVGVNDYYGAITKTYKITGTPLSAYSKADLVTNIVYTGKEIKQTDDDIRLYKTIKVNGVTTKEYLDSTNNYTIAYSNNINKGTATITYTGIDGYTGTLKKTFKIVSRPLTDTDIKLASIPSQPYTKSGNKPDVDITYKGTKLILNKDYTLSYKNNTKVGTASITVKGKGNYSGTLDSYFNIITKSLEEVSLIVNDKVYSNKANQYKPTFTLIDTNGKNLTTSDYDSKNIVYTYKYDTEVIDTSVKPNIEVTRKAGTIVNSKDIIPEGTILSITITGKGNYKDTITSTYKIIKSDISKATVKVSSQYYTGKPINLTKDDLTITLNKQVLSKDDYDIISYSSNINKGTGTITIKGKGNYGGYKTIKFTINSRALGLTIIFNPNGATTGTMTAQVITKDTALYANKYKISGVNFLGWSLTPDGPVEYTDKQQIKYDSFKVGTIITLYARFENTYSCGDTSWFLIKDNILYIYGEGDVINFPYPNDYDYDFFTESRSVTTIKIFEGITSINDCILNGCPATDIYIPKSLKDIGDDHQLLNITTVYYAGTAAEYSKLDKGASTYLNRASVVKYNYKY